MATLECVRHFPHRAEVSDDCVVWVAADARRLIERLPQIVWSDHTPWREANLWALQQASVAKKSIKTVTSVMTSLHAYAQWLEAQNVDWWHFPVREEERCLVRYRGALIEAMNEGEIAPSTTSLRMAVAVRFYRWLSANRLLSPRWPMWRERQVGIRIMDSFGFERTLKMRSTDLAIPNRARHGERLEDGLLPVSIADRDAILALAQEKASEELALMLRLGFRTGMRLGTITDLKIGTLDRAAPDPLLPGWYRLAVGPGARPAVHTKFGVTGQIWIEAGDLQSLKDYFYSVRRLKRQAQAKPHHRDLVFLSRFGRPYGDPGTGFGVESNRAIKVEMGRLRAAGIASGVNVLNNFHFHQSRCTFATELARVVLRHGGVSMAIQMVKEALLHKDEATTLKYIKFVEKSAVMAEVADEFTRSFLGLFSNRTT